MNIEQFLIQSISDHLPYFTKTANGHKFQCPYCQYGSKDKKGRNYSQGRVKGNLYTLGNTVKFHCFSCNEHKEFASFLREQFPDCFQLYVKTRDEFGLTGYQTNCPSLETVLKQQGLLPQHPPAFHSKEHPQELQQGHPSKATNAPARAHTPKITVLPPMRSPQQQAGCQASLNRKMKEREQRRRECQGW
jgi:hypothetical protein